MDDSLPSRPTPPVVRKRSVTIAGHRTSVSLEEPFWEALRDLARSRDKSINDLVTEIDADRRGNLSSAIRIHVLAAYRAIALGRDAPPAPDAVGAGSSPEADSAPARPQSAIAHDQTAEAATPAESLAN